MHNGAQLMKTPTLYNMILQAEDKNRSAAEILIYALLILTAVIGMRTELWAQVQEVLHR